jgi:hypothetical protein
VAQERALPTSAQSSTNAETERAVVRQYSDKGWCDNSLTAGSTAVVKTSHVLRFSQLLIAAWGVWLHFEQADVIAFLREQSTAEDQARRAAPAVRRRRAPTPRP